MASYLIRLPMERRVLGKTGMRVSILGFGASPLGNEFGPADLSEGIRAVHCAIDHGINYFDVAPYYGRTLAEERLGQALAGRRHQVFLATKCGRYDMDSFDFSSRRVKASIDESLERLQTDYVDLLQVHDIEFGDRNQIVEETLPALRRIQQDGKARFVGITGLQLKVLRDVAIQARVDTVLSFCRYNLMVDDMDSLLTSFLKEQGIGLVNASPLHMRILTEKGAPPWHPASDAVKNAGQKVVAYCSSKGTDLPSLALRYCLNHPYVATTLVGMSKEAHVKQNLRAITPSTDSQLLEEVLEIVAPVKNKMWATGRPENVD
jgi:L-galactose dehydrogenase